MEHKKPMNLLFLFSDEHSREKFGYYGNPYIHTPNLDRLAESGTCFKNAYCNFPICVPSRASMTTGDYAFKHSFWDNSYGYNGERDGFGHRLLQNGYRITSVGKLHFKGNFPQTGFPDQRIPLNIKHNTGDESQLIRDGSINRAYMRQQVINSGEGDSKYLEYDHEVAKQAAEILNSELTNETKPWCLFVGFVCPHFPWKVPKEIMDLYKPYDKLPFPKQYHKYERPEHPALAEFRKEFCYDEEFTDEEVHRAVAAYYSMVTYLDNQIGLVIKALEESGLSDSTRIIYSSDHGEQAGDHGLFFKHSMYEGSAGVPLILSGPDIPKKKIVRECVSLIDIYPTIMDCFDIELKETDKDLPGTSLLSVAKGESTLSDKRAVFAEYHALGFKTGEYMLRKGRFKLIYFAGGYPPQLFNLEDDPDELNDLSNDERFKPVLNDLTAELYKVADPEALSSKAKKEQLEKLRRIGGREQALKSIIPFSPVPDKF
ncbi:sulfatase-like hydrolase/transferase [Lachnospiraceae bacterium NSJ-143]|nr:sulfatase-like hydrolase/transferase [Lachnospiraceae bacterium NSJ-143]